MVLTFLSHDIQEHILRLKNKEPNVNISQNGIRITIYSHLRSDESFDEFVETGLAIIGKAKSLCRQTVWDDEVTESALYRHIEPLRPGLLAYMKLGIIIFILVVPAALYFYYFRIDKDVKTKPMRNQPAVHTSKP